jgi:putative component of membrane protein insertase Oxa1/YidC/SpoIIIJ protein YidD
MMVRFTRVRTVLQNRYFRALLVAVLFIGILNVRHAVCLGIVAYQQYVSPYKGWHFAYREYHRGLSCSEYGKRVIAEHGVLVGSLLLQERFRECAHASACLQGGLVADNQGCCAAQGDKACGGFTRGCKEGCTKGANR